MSYYNYSIYDTPVLLDERRINNLVISMHLGMSNTDSGSQYIKDLVDIITQRGYICKIPSCNIRTLIDIDNDFDFESPHLYIGHIGDQVMPVFLINEFKIVYTVIFENPEIVQSIDAFDDAIKSKLVSILELASDRVLNKDTWGTLAERQENVHDSSVNISLVNFYKHIRSNISKHNLSISNIRSFLFQTTTSLNMELADICKFHNSGTKLVEIGKNLVANIDTININDITNIKQLMSNLELYSTSIDHIINRTTHIKDTLVKLMNTMKVLYVMEKTNVYIDIYGNNEIPILLDVWQYMHTSHTDNLNNLLDMFITEMSKLVVVDKDDGVECANGRIATLLSVFETFDSNININCVASLRVQIIQNSTPVLYKQFLVENNITDNQVISNLLIDKFHVYLLEKTQQEYSSKLPDTYIIKYVDEAMQAFK